MDKFYFFKLCIITFVLSSSVNLLKAQVTIGSGETPVPGALLDLKQEKKTDGTANSKKGLGLPRVPLQAYDKLEPCAESTAENMIIHIGLTVYNTEETLILKKGVYAWNGQLWQPLNGEGEIGFGPWYDVETKKPAAANDKAAYLMGKAAIGIDTPIDNAQLSVEGKTNIQGNLGVDANAQDNASITLGAPNKGLRLNQVTLKGSNDMTTVPVTAGSDQGMIVFHMGGYDMDQGIYQWNGEAWSSYISILPPPAETKANILNLLVNTASTGVLGADNTALGTVLPVGEKDAEGYYIAIPEDGSYAFTFRLYGYGDFLKTVPANSAHRAVFYMAVMKNGELVDTAEMNPVVLDRGGTRRFVSTYSITLAAPDCKTGDRINFRFSHSQNDMISWTLDARNSNTNAARTSVAYWKL